MGVTLRKNTVVTNANGIYHRAAESKEHIYYVNFDGAKDNVILYDRKMSLISNDKAASNRLTKLLKDKKQSWLSKKMQENLVVSK